MPGGSVSPDVVSPSGRFVPFLGDGAAITGPATVTIDAPVDAIPVFVRLHRHPHRAARRQGHDRDLPVTGRRTMARVPLTKW